MTHEKTLPRTLGERVRWERKRHGLSLDTVAERAGTSRRHLIRIEQGTRPRPVMLARIAKAIGTDVAFLAGSSSDGEHEGEGDLALALMLPIRALVQRAIRESTETRSAA